MIKAAYKPSMILKVHNKNCLNMKSGGTVRYNEMQSGRERENAFLCHCVSRKKRFKKKTYFHIRIHTSDHYNPSHYFSIDVSVGVLRTVVPIITKMANEFQFKFAIFWKNTIRIFPNISFFQIPATAAVRLLNVSVIKISQNAILAT